MTIEQEIKTILETHFSPEYLEVINESYKHAGHAGDDGSGQTHFKLIVVSRKFSDCTRMQRQQSVNNAIKPLFDKGLHAVSMKLSTPQEVSA